MAVELVRMFQVELEHYEKIEGALLSLDGKAKRLSAMIRGNSASPCRGWRWCQSSPGTTYVRGRAASSATT